MTKVIYATNEAYNVYGAAAVELEAANEFRLPGGSVVVIVSPVAVDILSEEELAAIVAHELAHVRLDHLSVAPTYHLTGDLENCMRLELEADALAVKNVDPSHLLSALSKLTENAIRSSMTPYIAEHGWTEEDVSFHVAEAHRFQAPRYQALQAAEHRMS